MSKKKLEKALTDKDYLVSNDISGEVFAVLSKGKNQIERLLTACSEEYDCGDFKFSDVDDISGISFTITSEEADAEHSIKLLTAFIY